MKLAIILSALALSLSLAHADDIEAVNKQLENFHSLVDREPEISPWDIPCESILTGKTFYLSEVFHD